MFALNKPTTGDLGGIAGADRQCYRDAAMSGIDGDFRAVLTSRLQDIESIVFSKYRHLPVANAKVKLGYSLFHLVKNVILTRVPIVRSMWMHQILVYKRVSAFSHCSTIIMKKI